MSGRTFTPFPILTTERLTLRQLKGNDEQEIFRLRADPAINKYLDRQRSETIEDARSFINKINENIKQGDSLYWAITLSDQGILVGTICLFGFSADNHRAETGFELLNNFQGQGIMKEAAEKVIDYAFNRMDVKRLDAFVHKNNQRSIKLLEKLLFISSTIPDNESSDLLCYEQTNSTDNCL